MSDVELTLIIIAGVFGLVIGSFLNVVIHRVPPGHSVVRPPSHCPKCEKQIRARDNVPVISWLVLRGKCRHCGNPISARYPLVELATGALFALTAWHFGASWALPGYLYLAAIAVALTLIDLEHQRLPNAIVLPAYPIALGLLAVASAGSGEWSALLRAAIAGAVLYSVYFILMFIYPRGMGFGDVKLAGVLGMYLGWIGWGPVVVGAFAAFLVGGVIAIALLLTRRARVGSGIPFGPYMLLGALIGIGWGAPLWDSYLNFAGLV